MKKTRIISLAAAAVCSAAALTACAGTGTPNGGGGSSKFTGHWDVTAMEAGGESLDVQAIMNAAGGENAGQLGMDISEDGNFKLNIYGNEESKGTWKESGNNSIVLTVNGDDQTATLNGERLEMYYGEGEQQLTLVFTKDGAAGATESTEATEAETESTAAETEATEAETETPEEETTAAE